MGILEFARAVRLLTLEEIEKNKKTSKDCLYPGIDKYLIPKMTELGLYKEPWHAWLDDYHCDFPIKQQPYIEATIKENWFYYKEK